ncbi:MAG: 4a-hydroxytetrahydrobiopterin dehydratase [Balneolales bacterium]
MAQPLDQQQLQQGLSRLNGWQAEDDKLKKDFKFKNFRDAMAFINRLAFEAEELNHHPDLFNSYNKVSIRLSTHSAGGKITQNDLDLALKIDELHS